MIQVFESLSDCKQALSSQNSDDSLGFVPTLGGLHKGHESLIKRSKRENKKTIVSVFLNPTQFNNPEDLKNYPSSWEKDLKILKELEVDFVIKPKTEELYPNNYAYFIDEKIITQELCGKTRPGHFQGVLTVVMKLLNIVLPDRAYFGEKDYQQLLLIEKMVESFFIDTSIVGCPIVRDENGLALSSRNDRLSPDDRKYAALIYNTIKNSSKPLEEIGQELNQLGFKIDYLKEIHNRRFVAVFYKNVRLIDNVAI